MIHAARFSGRHTPAKPSQAAKGYSFGRKVGKWLIVLVLAAALVYTAKQAISFWQPLPNLPNQNNYPIGTNYKDRINLLLVSFEGEEVSWLGVLSISTDQKILFLPLDPGLTANLAGSRGEYRLASAWKLGNLDGGEGMNLLWDSVSRELAVPIDGYIATTDWPVVAARFGGDAPSILATVTSPFFLAKALVTDPWPNGATASLSRWEIWSRLTTLGDRDLESLSLSGVTTSVAVGGQGVPAIEAESFDSRLGPLFREAGIAKAHSKVSIVNASGIPGAAVELARYVRNLGGEVIGIESAATPAKKSTILDHTKGSLSSRLAPLIRADVTRDTQALRSDLEITIGENAQGVF